MSSCSLLVPCYNAEKYVLDFLKNIATLSQKFDEVIFYDDASTDKTVEILKNNNCYVIEGKENKGPGYARNQLVKYCSNEWFHFHDIDDYLHTNYLVEVSKDIDNVDVVLCNVDWISSKDNSVEIAFRYSDKEINKDSIAYTLLNPVGGINGLYNKKIFDKIKGFNTNLRMWEDSDFHVRLAIGGAKFKIIEKTLSFSIRRENTLSSNQKEAWKFRLICLENYYELLNNSPMHLKIVIDTIEKLASTFIHISDIESAKKAISFITNRGFEYPSKQKIYWKIIKFILPKNIVAKIRITQLKLAFKN